MESCDDHRKDSHEPGGAAVQIPILEDADFVRERKDDSSTYPPTILPEILSATPAERQHVRILELQS